MNQENGIHISFHVVQPEIQNIKYFVFKDEKYPVDFDKLKKNSKYFYRNQKQFKQIYDVSILDEADEKLITISDKAIQAFISSCQNEPAQINLSDVIPLQYLSYKYEFPNLISVTEKCIQENSDKLIFQSLLFKLSLRPNSKTFSILETKKKSSAIISMIILKMIKCCHCQFLFFIAYLIYVIQNTKDNSMKIQTMLLNFCSNV